MTLHFLIKYSLISTFPHGKVIHSLANHKFPRSRPEIRPNQIICFRYARALLSQRPLRATELSTRLDGPRLPARGRRGEKRVAPKNSTLRLKWLGLRLKTKRKTARSQRETCLFHESQNVRRPNHRISYSD